MAPRLSRATLDRVPDSAGPDVRPGIVHLGVGAFHRAHQAVYTERAVADAGGEWGIVGVAPRRREVIDQLAAQDGLFASPAWMAPGRAPMWWARSPASATCRPTRPVWWR